MDLSTDVFDVFSTENDWRNISRNPVIVVKVHPPKNLTPTPPIYITSYNFL
jgi:hypothetical protein